jgi:hypothetical protein
MSTSPFALSRQQIKSIAQTVWTAKSYPTANVVLGLLDIPETTELLAGLTTAPYLQILPADAEEFHTGNAPIMDYYIDCELWFGFTNNADYDYTAIEDVRSTLAANLADYTKYGTTPPPLHVAPGTRPSIRSDLSPIAGLYLLTVYFKGVNV